MATFIGDFVCKADAKGRIVLPAAFKKVLEAVGEDRFVVKKDLFEPCLILYPFYEWEKTMEVLRTRINPYNREHVRFQRNFQRNSAEMSLDGNGRFLVPRRLMESVNVDKEVILLGVDQRIELWSVAEFGSHEMSQEEHGQLAEKLLGFDH